MCDSFPSPRAPSKYFLPRNEGFTQRHAMINYRRNADYISTISPPEKGIQNCIPIPCPDGFGKDVICWGCKDIISLPQNELNKVIN